MTKKKRKPRTDDELRDASISLRYELWMLNEMANCLSTGVCTSTAVHNALVESFVVHSRNLIEFFYPTVRVNETTMIAADYMPDWRKDIPEWLDKVRKRAHRLLAHISYDRAEWPEEDKAWDEDKRMIGEYLPQLMSEFMAKVPPSNVAGELNEYCAEIGLTDHHEGRQNAR